MAQETIGQRLKFLMEALNLKVRTFAAALNVSETNIRNYTTRDSKPSSEILERIVRHYPRVNTLWLLTGEGDPLLPISDSNSTSGIQGSNISGGNNIGLNYGSNTQLGSSAYPPADFNDCRVKLAVAENEIQGLRDKLQRADALIAAKEETITVMRAAFRNPN